MGGNGRYAGIVPSVYPTPTPALPVTGRELADHAIALDVLPRGAGHGRACAILARPASGRSFAAPCSRTFLATVEFSLAVTGPIFLILGLGAWLRRIGLINDAFVEVGSRLVFNVTLPALLFISVAKTRLDTSANLALIGFGLAATLVAWGLSEVLAKFAVRVGTRSRRGGAGQLPLQPGHRRARLLRQCLWRGRPRRRLALCRHGHHPVQHPLRGDAEQFPARAQGVAPVLRSVATNPLIIGIVLALPVSIAGLRLPAIVLQSGEYFANMTLPLALLCTGAALDFRSLRHDPRDTLLAAAGKLLLVPLLFVGGGIAWGFRGMELGILLLMSSAPTAAASYVMVRAMGGNAALAANIIALTTLGSLLTTSVGVVVLSSLRLI
jgi:malonate transporter